MRAILRGPAFIEPLEGRRLLSATLSTIATFNASTGTLPANLVIDGAGNLYGTTSGPGDGTIFEIAANTHQMTTLVTFNGANGRDPDGLLVDSNGNLFGTAAGGGDLSLDNGYGGGTVFEIAAGSHQMTTLAVFDGPNGQTPSGGLVQDNNGALVEDASGNLYGSTEDGPPGGGTIFEIAAGTHTLSTLSPETLGVPSATDAVGNVYGSVADGVSSDYSVFEISANTNALTTLAQLPYYGDVGLSRLIRDADGNLDFTFGSSIFQLPAGSHAVNTVVSVGDLYFSSNGIRADSHGNLFGTSPSGPNHSEPAHNYGYVYEVEAGTHAVNMIATFDGTNGSYPTGSLVADAAGNLYGAVDPSSGDASVFEIANSGFAVGSSPPVIFTQPTGVTQLPGTTATFTAVVADISLESRDGLAATWQMSLDPQGFAVGDTGTLEAVTRSGTRLEIAVRTVVADSNGVVWCIVEKPLAAGTDITGIIAAPV